ncbi:late embryogenesis abundant protein Lea5-like isoform X1 [Camellia sinensis]|uniref:late embryogenesis abundant protein Lea5-like isoform X1 n=1 Tax=Camellia sinensis TaxID=4442 RepID=UPI001036A538|nr:late embryogenesis abundant protein Lea5-like isoform X1 [Camellia sinensis]
MARYLSSSVKFLTPSVANGISLSINMRAKGYAAASLSPSRGGEQAAASGGDEGRSIDRVVETVEEKDVVIPHSHSQVFGSTTTSWAPDPLTGYYRPVDRAAQIDSVDQREMFLTHKEIKHPN